MVCPSKCYGEGGMEIEEGSKEKILMTFHGRLHLSFGSLLHFRKSPLRDFAGHSL